MNQRFLYSNPDALENDWLRFSSELEKIGKDWDVQIRNNTEVIFIEGPIYLTTEKYGIIQVAKVMGEKPMWIRTDHLIPLDTGDSPLYLVKGSAHDPD